MLERSKIADCTQQRRLVATHSFGSFASSELHKSDAPSLATDSSVLRVGPPPRSHRSCKLQWLEMRSTPHAFFGGKIGYRSAFSRQAFLDRS
jgi:hypothetical protein